MDLQTFLNNIENHYNGSPLKPYHVGTEEIRDEIIDWIEDDNNFTYTDEDCGQGGSTILSKVLIMNNRRYVIDYILWTDSIRHDHKEDLGVCFTVYVFN